MKDREHRRREGRGRLAKPGGNPFRTIVVQTACMIAVSILGAGVLPLEASAQGSTVTSRAQVEVGTLPLLAALGIGIAVSVGAVIAFLHLTLRAKGSADPSLLTVNEKDAYDPLTEYTIPITKILAEPNEAEHAGEDEPRLCGIAGEHAGICYRILNRRLSIGRDPAVCGVVFPYEVGEVSRKHCTLRYSADTGIFFLEDHGSSNGTFLSNGERLKPGKTYELHAGDRFSLSGSEHCFEVRVNSQS